MYRICKVLNHNGVIALDMNDSKEYVPFREKVSDLGKSPVSVLNSRWIVPYIPCRRLLQGEMLLI